MSGDVIHWEMDLETGEQFYQYQVALDNYEMTPEAFAEEIAKLPGYPLNRLLTSGDDLRVLLKAKTITSGGGPRIITPRQARSGKYGPH